MCGQTTVRALARRGTAVKTAAAIALTCGLMASPVRAEDQKIRFDIESQALAEALNRFALRSDLEIFFAPELVDGKSSVALKGRYSPTEALDRLLRGTGLTFEVERDDLLIVRPIRSTAQGRSGDQSSNHSGGSQRRLAQVEQAERASGAGEQAGPARRVADERDDEGAFELEEMVVTGSHIRGVEPVGSELFVIDRNEIDRSGLVTIEQLVGTLPQNFGGTPGGDTVAVGTDENIGNSGLGSGINLRGLGADATLVLLNGRRLTGSGGFGEFVDVSSIPVSAIERIEVLADGASALYGTDAVGGVVNLIMRDDYEGAETTARFGTVTEGGLQEYQVGQTFGTSWGGGSALISYEYYRRENLLSEDRRFSASSDLFFFGGDNFGSEFSNPGNVFSLAPFGPAFAIPSGQDGTSLAPEDFLAGQVNIQNQREGTDVLPENERHSVFVSVKQSISDRIGVFAEGRYSQREFSLASQAPVAFIQIRPNNPFFATPTPGSTRTVVGFSFIDDLGPLQNSGEVERYGFVGGMYFEFGSSWKIEVYGSYNKEQADNRLVGVPNTTLLNEALGNFSDPTTGSPDNPETAFNPLVDGFFNPFGDGPVNATAVVEAIRGFSSNEDDTELWTVNAKADGVLFRLPAGDVRLAVGAEYREETLENRSLIFVRTLEPEPGEDDRFGRGVVAGFGELFVPLFSEQNRRPGFERLELSVAGRVEDYDDFGTTANPKVGVVWSPLDGLSVRGTYGTSFKAPSLPEISTADFRIRRTRLVDPMSPTGRTDVLFFAGGNADLLPEEATAFTVGTSITPTVLPGLAIDVGYFDIKFENRIAAPGIDNIASLLVEEELFLPFITRDPDLQTVIDLLNDPAYTSSPIPPELVGAIIDGRFVNTSSNNVRGLDFSVAYAIDTAVGAFDLRVSGSYLIDFEEQLTPTSPAFDRVDTVFNPVDLRLRNEISWTYQGFGASVFVNYTSGYLDNVSDPERRVDSWATVDFRVGYSTGDRHDSEWLNGVSLSLSIQNLLDNDPPFVNNASGVGFDPNNADPLNRFLALQVRKEW